jgi:hypothetical protein
MLDHGALHRRRRHGAAVAIDVEAVGCHAQRYDLGAQLPQHGGRHLVGGAMGAVDHHLEPVEPEAFGEAAFDEFDVAAAGVVEPLGAAERVRRHAMRRRPVELALDRRLDLVGELVPVGAEQLDAVILERIVRGRDHDAEIGAQAARQHGDGRRRQRPDQHDIHAHGDEARGQRRLDHIAREPRVLADDDKMAMVAAAQDAACPHRHVERSLGGHRLAVGGAANPIGAEQLARHSSPLGQSPIR